MSSFDFNTPSANALPEKFKGKGKYLLLVLAGSNKPGLLFKIPAVHQDGAKK